jgi:hypothetical protein
MEDLTTCKQFGLEITVPDQTSEASATTSRLLWDFKSHDVDEMLIDRHCRKTKDAAIDVTGDNGIFISTSRVTQLISSNGPAPRSTHFDRGSHYCEVVNLVFHICSIICSLPVHLNKFVDGHVQFELFESKEPDEIRFSNVHLRRRFPSVTI